MHWYDDYWWQWTIQNIVPTPVWALLVVAPLTIFRRRIKAWLRRHLGADDEIHDLKQAVHAAHQIITDLHMRMTGERHELAPEDDERRRS